MRFAALETRDERIDLDMLADIAEIRFEHSGEDLHSGGLADAVLADKPHDLAEERHGQVVEREHVLAVAMDGLIVERFGQIDDGDGIGRAFLDADIAADA